MATARPRYGIAGVAAAFPLIVALSVFAASGAKTLTAPPPPSLLFDGLYRDVALSGIYPDFKTFADAAPIESPETIMPEYRAHKPATPAALKRFVESHFALDRPVPTAPMPPPGLPLAEHIARLWPHLTRLPQTPRPYSAQLPLPRPYVVPGGRFDELYYWDSYFTMLGFGPQEDALRQDMIADFVDLIRQYGHIPNANRTYFLSRSQPPFFFAMVALTSADHAKAFARYLPELRREHDYWMRDSAKATAGRPAANVVRMPDGSLLNRYWDDRDTPRDEEYGADYRTAQKSGRRPNIVYRNLRAAAESGWDFSSRWLADGHSLTTIRTASIVPPDLNSLLYGLERAIESGCRVSGNTFCAADYGRQADERRAAMQRYLWNPDLGVYDDWADGKRLGHVTAAAFYPLFFGLASAEESARTVEATKILVKAGGLVTTTITTGQQWDAPNGWAPLQWMAVAGLCRVHRGAEARTIAVHWIGTVSKVYANTGKLLEKYDVVNPKPGGGGEYPLQDGFGWTNGVTMAFLKAYPDWRKGTAGADGCAALPPAP